MRVGAFYMHDKAMDVCVRVCSVEEKSGKCHVEWFNLGHMGKPWPIGQFDFIVINGNWLDISNLINIPKSQWMRSNDD